MNILEFKKCIPAYRDMKWYKLMMEHTWDNQLDNMLDDLQASVHTNGTTVHNSGTSVQTHSGSSKVI